jgi:hypothetical protein
VYKLEDCVRIEQNTNLSKKKKKTKTMENRVKSKCFFFVAFELYYPHTQNLFWVIQIIQFGYLSFILGDPILTETYLTLIS